MQHKLTPFCNQKYLTNSALYYCWIFSYFYNSVVRCYGLLVFVDECCSFKCITGKVKYSCYWLWAEVTKAIEALMVHSGDKAAAKKCRVKFSTDAYVIEKKESKRIKSANFKKPRYRTRNYLQEVTFLATFEEGTETYSRSSAGMEISQRTRG